MFIKQARLENLRRLQAQTQKRVNKKGVLLAIYNLAEAVVELDNLMTSVTVSKRKEIAKAAEPIALAAYKNQVPISKKPHKYYVKGEGLVYNIMPGNLRRSIKIISDVKNLKRGNSLIGPLYQLQGRGSTLGSEGKTDGFYAHMVYGNTRGWVKKVRNKAERAASMAVIQKMSQEALRMAQQHPRKFWEI
jgi:hypothetical protein